MGRVFCVSGALFAAFATISGASADPITITSYLSGGYTASGTYTATPGFQNYFVGYTSPSSPTERRNYFLFDLAPHTGTFATGGALVLYLPFFAPGVTLDTGPGYISPDPSELFVISGSTFSAATIGAPGHSAALATSIWATLGTGDLFGGIEVFPTMQGTDIFIPLTPAGLMAVNAVLGSGSLAIGGRIVSLDMGRPMVLDELLFAFTDIPGPAMIPSARLVLDLFPVPGPGSAAALSLCIMAAVRRRR